MAAFVPGVKSVVKKADSVSYGGRVVAFDDIVWKT
jgi:hypothetical protein